MSKVQLKKELSTLDREQLVQLILDLYSARKEAKAYFDFFVDPDITKLTEKFRTEIDKEMMRGRYRKSTARISKVRTFIRDYSSYGIGAEAVIELMIYALKVGLHVERIKYVSKTFISGITRLASDILKEGDKNAIFDSTLKLLEEALSGTYGYLNFVNYIRRELDWSIIQR